MRSLRSRDGSQNSLSGYLATPSLSRLSPARHRAPPRRQLLRLLRPLRRLHPARRLHLGLGRRPPSVDDLANRRGSTRLPERRRDGARRRRGPRRAAAGPAARGRAAAPGLAGKSGCNRNGAAAARRCRRCRGRFVTRPCVVIVPSSEGLARSGGRGRSMSCEAASGRSKTRRSSTARPRRPGAAKHPPAAGGTERTASGEHRGIGTGGEGAGAAAAGAAWAAPRELGDRRDWATGGLYARPPPGGSGAGDGVPSWLRRDEGSPVCSRRTAAARFDSSARSRRSHRSFDASMIARPSSVSWSRARSALRRRTYADTSPVRGTSRSQANSPSDTESQRKMYVFFFRGRCRARRRRASCPSSRRAPTRGRRRRRARRRWTRTASPEALSRDPPRG